MIVSKRPFFDFGYVCSSERCGPGASCFNGCGVSNLTHTQSTLDIFPHFLLFLFLRNETKYTLVLISVFLNHSIPYMNITTETLWRLNLHLVWKYRLEVMCYSEQIQNHNYFNAFVSHLLYYLYVFLYLTSL